MNKLNLKLKNWFLALAILTTVNVYPQKSHADLLTELTNLFNTVADGLGFLERVPPISVGGLDKYKGQYIKIYYVVGQSQFLNQQAEIQVLQIKRIDAAKISGADLSVPSVLIPKIAFFAAYNYVIIAISKDPNYTLYNPDGSLVQGQILDSVQPFDSNAIKVAVSKAELLAPSEAAGLIIPGEDLPTNLIPYKINF